MPAANRAPRPERQRGLTSPRGGRLSETVPAALLLAALGGGATAGCTTDTPDTNVVVDNLYPVSASRPLVIAHAFWHSVDFPDPVLPGGASEVTATIPASGNTAYVLLAPGWSPAGGNRPTSLVVLQSRELLELHQDNTLRILVDDSNFLGNCAAGSHLTQAQADFITQRIFPAAFDGFRYDSATCTLTPIPGNGRGGAGGLGGAGGQGG